MLKIKTAKQPQMICHVPMPTVEELREFCNRFSINCIITDINNIYQTKRIEFENGAVIQVSVWDSYRLLVDSFDSLGGDLMCPTPSIRTTDFLYSTLKNQIEKIVESI